MLFINGEWIWADSAYALEPWCITPYKKPLSLQRDNKKFNYWLSRVGIFYTLVLHAVLSLLQVRVKSEHCMGYLKGRFCSLRCLRQQIDSRKDHERALAWIKACLVLHTLIFQIENGEDQDAEFNEEILREGLEADHATAGGEDEIAAEARRETQGQQRREELKSYILAARE